MQNVDDQQEKYKYTEQYYEVMSDFLSYILSLIHSVLSIVVRSILAPNFFVDLELLLWFGGR